MKKKTDLKTKKQNFISLRDYCVKNHMEHLLEEWDRKKNGSLTPENVTAKSHTKVWWRMSYDDEKTGKHFDFSWESQISCRTSGIGCPYLSGRKILAGFNDLATTHPELAAQWHYEKNGNLKPESVTAKSGKKVWWLFSYDDKKTGKHFDFKWQASIANRVNGTNCPYISGHKVWKGFNDLATTYPELAAEWHPTRNGNLTPEDVTAGSGKKVWWHLSYDDERTGRHFNFEWQAQIASRVNGNGCPYLSGQALWKGFNDFATTHPKLAEQWDYERNEELTPENVTSGSEKKVWWVLSYDDPKTKKHFDFLWQNSIKNLANGSGCPYLTGLKVWEEFNDLATTHPELAAEWDYEKNKLLPSKVTAGSNRKVWWKCRICGHGWKSMVMDRKKSGCPKCAKELQTSFPEQAAGFYLEKHFPDTESRNRNVLDGKELDVYIPSIPAAVEYDGVRFHKNARRDMKKNQLCMEKGILLIRIREEGCPAIEEMPFLKVISCVPGKEESLADAIRKAGKILGINNMDVDISRDRQVIYSRYIKHRMESSLALTHPELAAQWHPVKNGSLTPENVTSGSNKRVWWIFPYDDPKTGKHFDFEWDAIIASRVKVIGCPFLSGSKVWKGFNDLATTHPELASEWNYEKNGSLTPEDVTAGSNKKIWWQLSYDDEKTGKHFHFEWQTSVVNRKKENGCPYLSVPVKAIYIGFNDLATTHPKLTAQWHPVKNKKLTPEDVTAGSGKKVWWLQSYDDKKTGRHFNFEWKAQIRDRAKGDGCPYLSGQAVWKGFNDLETYCKENGRLDILSQWDYEKNGDLKPSDVTAGSGKKVWWIKNGISCLKQITNVMR